MGQYWLPADTEQSLGALAYELAEHARKIYGPGHLGVQPGDIVLDCGASVGIFAREALARGAALVVAIEPAPETLECLRRNLVPEISEGRVVVYPKAVADKEGVLTLQSHRPTIAAARC